MKKIQIYTDGACKGNPGPGGWGVVLLYQHHEKHLYGAESHTTNNRMELLAAIKGLEAVKQACSIQLYTDSQYLRQGMTTWMHDWKKRGWKTATHKPIKNQELWQRLDVLNAAATIEWHWVKAHAGDKYNEMADALANRAVDELKKTGHV